MDEPWMNRPCLRDGIPLFVSALYLVGDQHGNMPATVECPPYV